MIEKYDYRKWLETQRENNRGKIREDSCIERFANLSFITQYGGDDTFGACLEYSEKIEEISPKDRPKGRPKRKWYTFTILVSQEGVKLFSFKSGKEPCPIEILQKMVDTIIAIKDSLDDFKFNAETALFWNDRPLTPDYIAPLWYHYNDKKPIKVEDVENYIKEKQLALELDQRTRENNNDGT